MKFLLIVLPPVIAGLVIGFTHSVGGLLGMLTGVAIEAKIISLILKKITHYQAMYLGLVLYLGITLVLGTIDLIVVVNALSAAACIYIYYKVLSEAGRRKIIPENFLSFSSSKNKGVGEKQG